MQSFFIIPTTYAHMVSVVCHQLEIDSKVRKLTYFFLKFNDDGKNIFY